jgi:hypothetical protein
LFLLWEPSNPSSFSPSFSLLGHGPREQCGYYGLLACCCCRGWQGARQGWHGGNAAARGPASGAGGKGTTIVWSVGKDESERWWRWRLRLSEWNGPQTWAKRVFDLCSPADTGHVKYLRGSPNLFQILFSWFLTPSLSFLNLKPCMSLIQVKCNWFLIQMPRVSLLFSKYLAYIDFDYLREI